MVELKMLSKNATVRTVANKILIGKAPQLDSSLFSVTQSIFDAFNSLLQWGPGDIYVADSRYNSDPELVISAAFDQWFEKVIHRVVEDASVTTDIAELAACLGSPFHIDNDNRFQDTLFAILWLGDEERVWDLVFPNISKRVPLKNGTVVIFDPGQPHGVVPKGNDLYEDEPFVHQEYQLFLTKVIHLNHRIKQKLGIVTMEGEEFGLNYQINPNSGLVTH